MVKAKTQLSKQIRMTKKEISDAGHVLQDKRATKKERTVAALVLTEARKKSLKS